MSLCRMPNCLAVASKRVSKLRRLLEKRLVNSKPLSVWTHSTAVSYTHLGPTLRCTIGEGEKQLMLMGHMDTVFPHEVSVPFTPLGDGRAKGGGLTDMKGGLVVMLYALRKALPVLDLKRYRLCVVLNPDEELSLIHIYHRRHL